MGKTKQTKEKKFDRNIEISAPILDPEVIKQIHSPPKEQRLDIKHGGFKALLSDFNSQDSTDEVVPIMDSNHLPSYIGISCAVSGYSGYSAYNNRAPLENISNAKITSENLKASKQTKVLSTPTRSQTNSPTANRFDGHHVNHITIDRSHIESADQERKELTEKLTASVSERKRSPSPMLPAEDERHHGAYVGARYFPMPPPSKLVHKHIPLLGIDDDQDPDLVQVEDGNKVEKKIETLYGGEFVEDWKESMSHKSKREHFEENQLAKAETKTNPKDLVTLRPTPVKTPEPKEISAEHIVDVPTPNVKVLAGVEKQFLNRLLTDENPPMPKSPSPVSSPQHTRLNNVGSPISPDVSLQTTQISNVVADTLASTTQSHDFESHSERPQIMTRESPISPVRLESRNSVKENEEHISNSLDNEPNLIGEDHGLVTPQEILHEPEPEASIEKHEIIDDNGEVNHFGEAQTYDQVIHQQEVDRPVSISPDSSKSQSSLVELTTERATRPTDEEHIEYEIRAQSPVDNQSSPIKVSSTTNDTITESATVDDLVSFSPEPKSLVDSLVKTPEGQVVGDVLEIKPDLDEITKSNHEESNEVNPSFAAKNVAQSSERLVNLEESGDSGITRAVDEKHQETVGNDNFATVTATEETIVGDNNNKDGHYFLNLLEQEKSFISDQVKLAEARLIVLESQLDEETLGRIRSAIGKANLLVNKKCNQFKELCERGINRGEDEQYAVLNDDLAGFWDMLSIQISDVRKSFEQLNL